MRAQNNQVRMPCRSILQNDAPRVACRDGRGHYETSGREHFGHPIYDFACSPELVLQFGKVSWSHLWRLRDRNRLNHLQYPDFGFLRPELASEGLRRCF